MIIILNQNLLLVFLIILIVNDKITARAFIKIFLLFKDTYSTEVLNIFLFNIKAFTTIPLVKDLINVAVSIGDRRIEFLSAEEILSKINSDECIFTLYIR